MIPRIPWTLFCGALVVIVFIRTAVQAHDLWLVPDRGISISKPAIIRANSGMDFPKSVHAPDPAAFARRILILPDGGSHPLEAAGQSEHSGLLRFQPTLPGVYVAGVETQPKVIELAADKFNEYLVSDGLPHIYRLRAKENTLDQPARERYSKSPKALLQVGDGKTGNPSRVLGLTLEIVPLVDPFQLRVGDTLRVRVLFREQPLADAHLGWDHPGDGEPPSGTVRTDADGEALLPIAHTGLMTVRLTHMTRPKTADYEWESFWTTLTFDIPSSKREASSR